MPGWGKPHEPGVFLTTPILGGPGDGNGMGWLFWMR
jgi:hypothetical protein